MKLQKRLAALLSVPLLFSLPGSSSQRLDEALATVKVAPETEETLTDTPEVEPEPEPRWMGRGFSPTEQQVLSFLQDRGITDRNALAVILGNIKQESRFDTQICEGGRRTGYGGCHTGGFGLIQWTTSGRYRGLGQFSAKYGLDPNTLEAQLRWMVNEREWMAVEHIFKAPNQSKGSYMNAAYRWLGWGVHGARSHYAHSYYNDLYVV